MRSHIEYIPQLEDTWEIRNFHTILLLLLLELWNIIILLFIRYVVISYLRSGILDQHLTLDVAWAIFASLIKDLRPLWTFES